MLKPSFLFIFAGEPPFFPASIAMSSAAKTAPDQDVRRYNRHLSSPNYVRIPEVEVSYGDLPIAGWFELHGKSQSKMDDNKE